MNNKHLNMFYIIILVTYLEITVTSARISTSQASDQVLKATRILRAVCDILHGKYKYLTTESKLKCM